jgi:glutathione synthase/RimK-type ligase-like ATP-grasp enzyme
MSRLVIVVENIKDWAAFFPSEDVISAKNYLHLTGIGDKQPTEVINLCRSYRYLGPGYYCSLLAEGRGHRVIPAVRTINDLSRKSIYSLDIEDLDKPVQKALTGAGQEDSQQYSLKIYFGMTSVAPLAGLAQQIFELFACPILNVKFRKQRGWQIDSIKAVAINTLTDPEEDEFAQALDTFSRKIWRKPRSQRRYRYDLAMLHNPNEAMPPSNKAALKQFIAAGRQFGIDVDLVEANAYNRLAEYDGLFIRETTAINHHTYRFSKRAEREGLVVIDDPTSILRCTNKIFLFELLTANKIPIPRTQVIYREDHDALAALEDTLGFPMILKIPDGSFSRGMSKVETPEELRQASQELFKQSVLVLAQEFFYTDYDWRIGILNRKPLYACQYFMAKGHWQIYDHNAPKQSDQSGDFRTLSVYEAPAAVLKAATRAANLIGNGLYGVDIKQRDNEVAVIEVNENPNIDAGIEDAHLGKSLYLQIMDEFLRRFEQRRAK